MSAIPIPEELYFRQLTIKETPVLYVVERREDSLAQAIIQHDIVLPLYSDFMVTSASSYVSGGAAQTVVKTFLGILPQGIPNPRVWLDSDNRGIAFAAGRDYVIPYPAAKNLYLTAGTTITFYHEFSAGVAANTCRAYLTGFYIPRIMV